MITLICQQCGREFLSTRRNKKYCSCACANTKAANNRSKAIEDMQAQIVWSSGGGIQSTAIAALIYSGVLPKPDFAVMIDTGYESDKTYSYLERIIRPKLSEVGVKFNLVSSEVFGGDTKIIGDTGLVNIPAFRKNSDGSVSHLATWCNNAWKVKVLRRWLREQGVEKCIDWVGISTDESRRANKDSGVKWITNAYPLIELGMDRTACVEQIKKVGWEMPVRTSCVFCPNRTNYEWLRLKYESPSDFEQACQLDEYLRKVRPDIWLHSSCRPLREVMMSE